jgi:hypothetical protein
MNVKMVKTVKMIIKIGVSKQEKNVIDAPPYIAFK